MLPIGVSTLFFNVMLPSIGRPICQASVARYVKHRTTYPHLFTVGDTAATENYLHQGNSAVELSMITYADVPRPRDAYSR